MQSAAAELPEAERIPIPAAVIIQAVMKAAVVKIFL